MGSGIVQPTPGRCLFPCHVKMHLTPFKNCALLCRGRTDPAYQVPARDMLIIEDMDEKALPTSYDDSADCTVQSGKKFEQVGVDAAHKVLQSAFEGVEFDGRKAIVIADVSLGVGDMFQAWVKFKGSYQVPCFFFFGVAESDVHKKRFEITHKAKLVEMFNNGSLMIPGFTPAGAEPPKEIMEAAPPKPALNVATWLADKTDSPGEPKGVRIPQALMNLYYQHEVFGKEFRAFVDDWVAAFGAGTEDPHDQIETCVVGLCFLQTIIICE